VKRRLSEATLAGLPAAVRWPSYARRGFVPGVVHFGPGAFHRVHQAWYLDRALATDPRWAISAVSLRSATLRDSLAPQDGLYTLAIRDRELSFAVIGSIAEILVARAEPVAVIARLAHPATRLVTLTVTEKGYCLAPDRTLDLTHPDIAQDLADPGSPASAIGYLVAGLAQRRAAGLAAPTIVSCDNLSGNGRLLGRAVVALAAVRDRELADWIEDEVAFPCTMVDSITPATTPALIEEVATALGVEDAWPVQREAWVQWVIEDRFCNETPDWAALGVTVSDDVAAHERAKLRLLNGAHSSLAYLGLLTGHETVLQAMDNPALAGLVREMMLEDIRPSLARAAGLDPPGYIDAVLARFRNPAMRHELAQIAWDGSQKLPIRLLGTIADNLAAGRRIDRLCLPIAAWMHFIRRRARDGVVLVDPLAKQLLELGRACTGAAAVDVALFLNLEAVFTPALSSEPTFQRELVEAYRRLDQRASQPPSTGMIAPWT
jgi:fructuronate reductase